MAKEIKTIKPSETKGNAGKIAPNTPKPSERPKPLTEGNTGKNPPKER